MSLFNKALVAIDLDEASARTVLEAARQLTSGTATVVHAVEPQYVQYSVDPTFTGSLTAQMEADAKAAAIARLADLCKDYDIPTEQQVVMLGRAADSIHQLARELDADGIIIGSHARKGLGRLLGSTANAVLHGAPVNVMTIRLGDES
ncbi:MAG: universal stress protein [Pseudomonadota bacterium]